MSPPAVTDLLRALARVLGRRRIRWYVFGAQATVAFGRPRMTADVDVTADVPYERLSPLIRALEAAGFSAREPNLDAFIERTRVVPLVHERSGIPLDLVLAGEGLEKEFFARVRRVDFGGVRAPVLSPEDLIATKILAGRAKDYEDVRGILDEQGDRIDVKRIRDVLTRLEQALDRSDLLHRFAKLYRG